jgi:hypothetical protein
MQVFSPLASRRSWGPFEIGSSLCSLSGVHFIDFRRSDLHPVIVPFVGLLVSEDLLTGSRDLLRELIQEEGFKALLFLVIGFEVPRFPFKERKKKETIPS